MKLQMGFDTSLKDKNKSKKVYGLQESITVKDGPTETEDFKCWPKLMANTYIHIKSL